MALIVECFCRKEVWRVGRIRGELERVRWRWEVEGEEENGEGCVGLGLFYY